MSKHALIERGRSSKTDHDMMILLSWSIFIACLAAVEGMHLHFTCLLRRLISKSVKKPAFDIISLREASMPHLSRGSMTTGLEVFQRSRPNTIMVFRQIWRRMKLRVGGVYPPVHTSTPKWQKRPRKAGHLARDLASITRETLSPSLVLSTFWSVTPSCGSAMLSKSITQEMSL